MEKNNELEKEITLDDLALMIGKGFNKIDERFEKMDEKMNNGFVAINERFEKVDERFDRIEAKLGNIEAEVNKRVGTVKHNDLIYRVEKLEEKFA